ncbi:MAG: hypothetical protein HYX83_00485 [Chloroflexi bacterium]|nr:hypothetical protein [Chloroflexota bacterium]
MIKMECGACHEFYSDNPMNIAKHIVGKFDDLHSTWLNKNGFDPTDFATPFGKGNLQPLADYIEKKAKKK